ncbi:MAG: hypothetical protein RR834_01175 [Thermomonas sp.]
MASSERMLPRAESATMMGRAMVWIVALAIPAVVGLTWRYGLFTGTPRSYCMLLGAIAALALGVVALEQVWRRAGLSPALLLVLGAMVAFVAYCGPAAAFAGILLLLCAIAVVPGKWIVTASGSLMADALVGIAILSAVVGWLLPFPVHGSRGYLAVAALLCVLRRDVIAERLAAPWEAWRALERDHGHWLAIAVAAALVAGLGLWLPTMNYDDNAAHLILPYQLLGDGYYHLDASTQAWALAPWANNVLNGIAALFAGGEARAAVNALWLLVGLHGAWRLAITLGAGPRAALAAVAVFATLPLTGYFTTTMQVDGASAAVLLQLAALLAASGRSLPPAMLVGSLLGLLAGLKVTNAVFVFPAIAWLGWQAFRQGRVAWCMQVAGVAALLGGASYCYAILITGNPLFPLFNGTFKSPYFPPTDLVDGRWMGGLSWRALWDMTFDTGRFGEHYPGAFGIALLALFPALLVEMMRRPASRWVGLWFLVAGLVMFVQIQYMRYLFPATAVLVVVGTVGLSRLLPSKPFAGSVMLLVVANALLLPASSWLVREDPWSKLVREGPRAVAAVESARIPERALLRRVLAESPHACIIVANPEAPFGAIAGGRAIVAHAPYDTRTAETYRWANADPAGQRWKQVLASTGTSHVITGRAPAEGLQRGLVASGFVQVDVEGASGVWAMPDPGARSCAGKLEQARDEAHRRFHAGDIH